MVAVAIWSFVITDRWITISPLLGLGHNIAPEALQSCSGVNKSQKNQSNNLIQRQSDQSLLELPQDQRNHKQAGHQCHLILLSDHSSHHSVVQEYEELARDTNHIDFLWEYPNNTHQAIQFLQY